MGHPYSSKRKRTCECCKGSGEIKIDKNRSFRDALEHLSIYRIFFNDKVNIKYLRFLKNNKWNDCPVCSGLGYEMITHDEWVED